MKLHICESVCRILQSAWKLPRVIMLYVESVVEYVEAFFRVKIRMQIARARVTMNPI